MGGGAGHLSWRTCHSRVSLSPNRALIGGRLTIRVTIWLAIRREPEGALLLISKSFPTLIFPLICLTNDVRLKTFKWPFLFPHSLFQWTRQVTHSINFKSDFQFPDLWHLGLHFGEADQKASRSVCKSIVR